MTMEKSKNHQAEDRGASNAKEEQIEMTQTHCIGGQSDVPSDNAEGVTSSDVVKNIKELNEEGHCEDDEQQNKDIDDRPPPPAKGFEDKGNEEEIPAVSMSSAAPLGTAVSMATDPQPGFSGIHRTLTNVSCSLSFGSQVSSVDDHVCRICWMGEEKEECIRPCKCSGSSAYIHANCLRKWLQVSNDYHCEICQFKYQTKVRMKPFSEWRWKPEKSRALSQMEATLILLGVVTPPLICGIILCTQKVIEYIDAPDHAWKIAALMTLVMASAGTYLAALIYFFQKTYAVCQVWMGRNRQTMVKVGDIEVMVEMPNETQNETSQPANPQPQPNVDAASGPSQAPAEGAEVTVWSIS